NICWDAIKLDPATAKIWAPRYKDLMQIAVKRGKVASAMMLGNLYGDMLQGGKGAEDFKMANQALLDALAEYREDPSYDFLQVAVDSYPICFRDELLGNTNTSDPQFSKLQATLAAHGVTIPRPTRETPHDLCFPTGAAPQ
ncbi:MAG: hypothetical protein NTW21_40615, partial [Verrucomicrobia bacterium]|nr:hypothetical protein [Verrucomicrobiota bacterium]